MIYKIWLRSKDCIHFSRCAVVYVDVSRQSVPKLPPFPTCFLSLYFLPPHLLLASPLHPIMAPSNFCPSHAGISIRSSPISRGGLAILFGQWDPANIWSNILEASSDRPYMQHRGTCHIWRRTCVCDIPIATTDCLQEGTGQTWPATSGKS